MRQRAVIGSVASKTVILMLKTVRVKEDQKPSKTLEALLEQDPCQTQQELASVLGVTHQATSKRLHALRMVQKQATWVPYELKPRDVERRFFACEQLLQRQKRKVFLHRIVTGDEKSIHWIDSTQRKENHGDCSVMLLRRRLGRIFTQQNLRSVNIRPSRRRRSMTEQSP